MRSTIPLLGEVPSGDEGLSCYGYILKYKAALMSIAFQHFFKKIYHFHHINIKNLKMLDYTKTF